VAGGAGYAKDDGDEDTVAKCSEATLQGTYVTAQDGVEINGKDEVPFAVAGYEVFDGNGKAKVIFSSNFNGDVVHNEALTGTYTVKANCTGTTTYTIDGVDLQSDLFVAPDGSTLTFVRTNPPELIQSGFELRGSAKQVGD